MDSSEVTLIFAVLLFFVVVYFMWKISSLNQTLRTKVDEMARSQFNSWADNQLSQARNDIEASTKKEYEAKFLVWITDKEEEIRKDATKRSAHNLLGRIGEEFSPVFLSEKYNVALNDFRHLGSPVDFIGFKGLSDDSESEVIFIEIKTGNTKTLQAREKKVKKAIDANRVRYVVESMNALVGNAKSRIDSETDSLLQIDRQQREGV